MPDPSEGGLFVFQDRLASHPTRRAILTRYALRVLLSTHLASVTTPPVLLIIMSTKEDDVQNAFERFEQKEFRSIRQTALATTQVRSTLGHRRARRLPRSQITVRNARLTKQQKEVLVRYI